MTDAPRVLLVDDQPESRMLLRVFLRRVPVAVDEACDGAEAVQRLAAARYDLVLMDVHMPGTDGLTATRAIREQERASGRERTTILALTADDGEDDRDRSLQAGCDDHVSKPISRKRLHAVLTKWIDLAPRLER